MVWALLGLDVVLFWTLGLLGHGIAEGPTS
jgi:hypothetical protein